MRYKSLAIAVAACCAVLTAMGVVRVALAEVVIRPRIEVSGELSDNFYQSQENTKSVYTYKISPGINIEAWTEKSTLNLDYTLDGVMYQEKDDSDVDASDDDYIGHNLDFSASYKPFDKLELGLGEEFLLTRERGFADRFSIPGQRSKYWRNRVKPSIKYNLFDKGSVELAYRNEVLNFRDQVSGDGKEDSTEHRGILTLTYDLKPRQSLNWVNQGWRRTYDESLSTYDSYQTELVYRHELTELLRAYIGFGYQWRDFESNQMSDWDDWMMSAGIEGEFSKTKLFVELERNVNDFATADEYITAWRLNFAGERRWGRLITRLNGFYQNGDYFEQDREDTTYNITGGIGYSFLDEFLDVVFSYAYTDNDSDISGFDYQENQFFLTIRYEYDTSKK